MEPPSSLVKLKVPHGTTTVYGRSGQMHTARRGLIEVPEEDVSGLLAHGFKRVDEVKA